MNSGAKWLMIAMMTILFGCAHSSVEKELDRKEQDYKRRDALYLEKWKQLGEEQEDFNRRYRDRKKPVFEEFPKPKTGLGDEKRLEFDDSPKPKRNKIFDSLP